MPNEHLITSKDYRPSIDGLRAIAVLSVLAFHTRSIGLSGGYFGVDIFFVISGYLISRLIFRELESGSFSLSLFYKRRARRILPALILVLFSSALVGTFIAPPAQLFEIAGSVLACMGFLANIFFWLRSDYFAEPAELTPLLHTWSLAVEEQFYFAFPLLLILAWRNIRVAVTPMLLIGTLIAFVLAHRKNVTDPSAAFYLIQYRAWELMVGAVVARLEYLKWRSTVLPIIGLAMIATSLLFLGGQIAIIPVVGAALIILFGSDDPASRLLSTRPLVWIGLISYSLYLWHQPIFAFARLYMINAPTLKEYAILTLVCFGMAAVSWRYVERPFRSRTSPSSQVSVLTIAVVLMAAAMLTILLTQGWPQRYSAEHLALLRLKPERGTVHVDGRSCSARSVADACRIGKNDTSPTFAILGDSHAETLTGPLAAILEKRSISAFVFTNPGCPFISSVAIKGYSCPEFIDNVFAAIEKHGIKNVIINDRGNAYIVGTRFDNEEGGVEPGDGFPAAPVDFVGTNSARMQSATSALRSTITRLLDMGVGVYYILPVPEAGWHVPRTIIKLAARGGLPLTTSLERYITRNAIVLRLAAELSSRNNFVAIYPHLALCRIETGRCYTHSGSITFYTDTDHLSSHGAELIASEISAALR